MSLPVCTPKELWMMVTAQAVYVVLEFWLGRTKRITANSVLELVLLCIVLSVMWAVSQLSKLKRKKAPNG